jgi:glycerol-3-phosphate dehydrogenase
MPRKSTLIPPPPAPRWERAEHLDRLGGAGSVDLMVIGGGIVGVGVALDAAGRGLDVALVEQGDFGSGTSSRSTKLLHGGIRYLPQLRFGLIREGLREQDVLAVVADYLYEPLDFVIPMFKGRGFGDLPVWARSHWIYPLGLRFGLWAYDLLGGRVFDSSRRHRTISADEAAELVPGLGTDGLKRAFVYTDAQTDDARLTLAVIKTAVGYGNTLAVNWATATGVAAAADGYQVTVTDRLGDREFDVTARSVVAATGAFVPPSPDGRRALNIIRSKGAHLVTRLDAVGLSDTAVVLPETDDDRILYVLPWQGHAVIGTTDTAYGGDLAHPDPDTDDVEYLMRHVHEYLDAGDDAPISAWAGLRALADTEGGSTASASREHKIHGVAPGYLQVAGGKLTGYRSIAADVVDGIADHLGVDRRSTTAAAMLVGAGAEPSMVHGHAKRLVDLGFEPSYGHRLWRRFGTHAEAIVTDLEQRPERRPSLGDGTTLAELHYATEHEAAARLSDITLRRTRLSWFTPDHGRDDAGLIADTLGDALGWDEETRKDELGAFEQELIAEGL